MTMTLATTKLGTITYTEAEIIHFPKGLLGFEDIKHYLLIKNQHHSVLYFLQAIANKDLCFVLVYPNDFFADYSIESDLPHDYTHHFAIVSQREEESSPTVNLLGPIIIHQKSQKGWQIISNNSAYNTRHPFNLHPTKPSPEPTSNVTISEATTQFPQKSLSPSP